MEQVVQFMLANGWTPGATGIWLIAGMFMIYLLREWRETRKLSAEDRQARREGYARQVSDLTEENRKQRLELHEVQKQFDEYRKLCRLETDQLREEIRGLQDEITGMKRQEAGLHAAANRKAVRDAQL